MTGTEDWLAEYGDNHSHTGNRILHWSGVALAILGTVGLLWSVPVPEAFLRISPLLNWGVTFLMAAMVYYFIISIALAIGIFPLLFATAVLASRLSASMTSLVWPSVMTFGLGLAGLYLGKGKESSIRSLARDVQLVMIAPVWLLARLYRRMGIPF